MPSFAATLPMDGYPEFIREEAARVMKGESTLLAFDEHGKLTPLRPFDDIERVLLLTRMKESTRDIGTEAPKLAAEIRAAKARLKLIDKQIDPLHGKISGLQPQMILNAGYDRKKMTPMDVDHLLSHWSKVSGHPNNKELAPKYATLKKQIDALREEYRALEHDMVAKELELKERQGDAKRYRELKKEVDAVETMRTNYEGLLDDMDKGRPERSSIRQLFGNDIGDNSKRLVFATMQMLSNAVAKHDHIVSFEELDRRLGQEVKLVVQEHDSPLLHSFNQAFEAELEEGGGPLDLGSFITDDKDMEDQLREMTAEIDLLKRHTPHELWEIRERQGGDHNFNPVMNLIDSVAEIEKSNIDFMRFHNQFPEAINSIRMLRKAEAGFLMGSGGRKQQITDIASFTGSLLPSLAGKVEVEVKPSLLRAIGVPMRPISKPAEVKPALTTLPKEFDPLAKKLEALTTTPDLSREDMARALEEARKQEVSGQLQGSRVAHTTPETTKPAGDGAESSGGKTTPASRPKGTIRPPIRPPHR